MKFILVPERGEQVAAIRQHHTKSSFAEVIRSNNWTTEATKGSTSQTTNSRIIIPGSSVVSEDDVLGRCIVGKFLATSQETPTLNDIWRWVCSVWNSSLGINPCIMNDSEFLFELPSRKEAEHVLKGEWIWKKSKLTLDWQMDICFHVKEIAFSAFWLRSSDFFHLILEVLACGVSVVSSWYKMP